MSIQREQIISDVATLTADLILYADDGLTIDKQMATRIKNLHRRSHRPIAKDCPFCGSGAFVNVRKENCSPERYIAFVNCGTCGIEQGSVSYSHKPELAEDRAIRNWNKRINVL